MRLWLCVLALWAGSGWVAAQSTDEEDALEWLAQYNEESQVVLFEYVSASWDYNTNLTDENLQAEVCVCVCVCVCV